MPTGFLSQLPACIGTVCEAVQSSHIRICKSTFWCATEADLPSAVGAVQRSQLHGLHHQLSAQAGSDKWIWSRQASLTAPPYDCLCAGLALGSPALLADLSKLLLLLLLPFHMQVCRLSSSDCEIEALCDGSSAACPPSAPAPKGTL